MFFISWYTCTLVFLPRVEKTSTLCYPIYLDRLKNMAAAALDEKDPPNAEPLHYGPLWDRLQQPAHTPEELEHLSKQFAGHHFIVIDGMMSELVKLTVDTYFMEAIECATKMVGAKNVHHWQVNSRRSIVDSVPDMRAKIEHLQEETKGEPLVFIGHSLGPAILLMTFLYHPEIATEQIKFVICIQGAFGGSKLAKYVKGHRTQDANPADDKTVKNGSKLMRMASLPLAFTVGKFIKPTVGALHPTIAKTVFERALEVFENKNKLKSCSIFDRVYYVRSIKPPNQPVCRAVSLASLMFSRSLDGDQTKSDAMVEIDDQHLTSVEGGCFYGHDKLGVIEGDHCSIVLGGKLSNITTPAYRCHVFYCLLSSVVNL
jgi:hypothetical protein